MKCQELLRILGDYVDGEVDPEICEEFEKHLAGCNPCQIVIDNIRKTITIYKQDQPFEIPADFRAQLHRILRDRWRTRESPEE
jgi:anti-sigma factor RsiW